MALASRSAGEQPDGKNIEHSNECEEKAISIEKIEDLIRVRETPRDSKAYCGLTSGHLRVLLPLIKLQSKPNDVTNSQLYEKTN